MGVYLIPAGLVSQSGVLPNNDSALQAGGKT